MTKISIIIAITAVASIISITLPSIIEHLGGGLHLATIIISGHHIIEEIEHSIHHKRQNLQLHAKEM